MTSGASLHIIGSIGMRYEDSIAIFERIMHGIIGLYVHAKYYCECPMMAAHIKQCDTLASHEAPHDALEQEKNIWYLSVRIYTHYPRGKLQFIRIKGMDRTWFIT
eukprot:827187_1